MAILKPYVIPQGFSASYHKILKVDINATTETLDFVVGIYASTEARDDGRPAAWHEYPQIKFADLTQDPRDLLYPALSHHWASYLKGGVTDAEGSGAPGDFTITLKPEAMEAPQPPPPETTEPITP